MRSILSLCKLSKSFDVKVGYSDHTKGSLSIAAVALGATIMKHFTLDSHMEALIMQLAWSQMSLNAWSMQFVTSS